MVNAQLLRELFDPACRLLPDYDPNLGPPVVHIEMSQTDGKFA